MHSTEHIHFHCCVIDALFYLDEGELRISELPTLGKADIAAIQTRVSRRVLRWFVRRGLLDADDAQAMREWHNDGGFSLDAAVRIPGWDRAGLERLLRYCARPPFALDRLEAIDDEHLRYHFSKPQADGTTELRLTPLELIDRIAALVPPPRVHRHRYHGVLAPNSPLRAQASALARDTATDEAAPEPDSGESSALDQPSRSPARYLWATLIARLFELFPLTCPDCGADMKIIAFVIETPSVRAILEHIGEPTRPPAICRARPCATPLRYAPALRPSAAQSCSAWVPAQTFLGLGVRCSVAAHPAPLGYQPKPSMVWSFAAQSQLTHPHGTMLRLRSIRTTISSPNRIRRWNSISVSGGSGLPRQRAQQTTA